MAHPNKNPVNRHEHKRAALMKYLKQGSYHVDNNDNQPDPNQQQRYNMASMIPNRLHRCYGHAVVNNPLAMNNGSRVICKHSGVHGHDQGGMPVQYFMFMAAAPPARPVAGRGADSVKVKRGMEHGGVDLGLLKEEENVPEGIDLSLKLSCVGF